MHSNIVRGIESLLADPAALALHIRDCATLERMLAPRPHPVAWPKPVRVLPAKAGAAGLLICRSNGRGGFAFQLVHGGTHLAGDDARAEAERRLTAHPVDAATLACGPDAAAAHVFGATAFSHKEKHS